MEGIELDKVYIWFDLACVEQDDLAELVRGVNALGLYITACDAFVSIDHPEYWSRAWCLVEQEFARCAGVRRYVISEGKLAPTDHEVTDPRDGNLTVEDDRRRDRRALPTADDLRSRLYLSRRVADVFRGQPRRGHGQGRHNQDNVPGRSPRTSSRPRSSSLCAHPTERATLLPPPRGAPFAISGLLILRTVISYHRAVPWHDPLVAAMRGLRQSRLHARPRPIAGAVVLNGMRAVLLPRRVALDQAVEHGRVLGVLGLQFLRRGVHLLALDLGLLSSSFVGGHVLLRCDEGGVEGPRNLVALGAGGLPVLERDRAPGAEARDVGVVAALHGVVQRERVDAQDLALVIVYGDSATLKQVLQGPVLGVQPSLDRVGFLPLL